MKDGRISLERAIKCYQPARIEPHEPRYLESQRFYQKYGFHFEEIWNLDVETAYFILIHLIQLRKVNHGCPCNFSRGTAENNWAATAADFRRWETQLDKMIRGFYLYCTIFNPDKHEQKIINKAIKLFAEHFYSLWN